MSAGQRSTASKHTPGPWRWESGEKPIDIATFSNPFTYCDNPTLVGQGGEVLSCGGEYDMIRPYLLDNKEQYIANARLIAAAPELLAALEESLVFLDDDDPKGLTAIYVRSVIAKAKGE